MSLLHAHFRLGLLGNVVPVRENQRSLVGVIPDLGDTMKKIVLLLLLFAASAAFAGKNERIYNGLMTLEGDASNEQVKTAVKKALAHLNWRLSKLSLGKLRPPSMYEAIQQPSI